MLQNKIVSNDIWENEEMPVESTEEAVTKNIETAIGNIIEIINKTLQEKSHIIIAIDGRCAAGKTTLAGKLQEIIDCNLFHMDDFFLRPEQRTEERLAMPGENVDHERFLSEVLTKVRAFQAANTENQNADLAECCRNNSFSYRPYDCSTKGFKNPIIVMPKRITIVEGSYSCHNTLWEYYDLRIFMDVDSDVQISRIRKRNGEEGVKRFREIWIPLEEKYFETFAIEERCQIKICNCSEPDRFA